MGLYDSELQVMEVLWDKGPMTAGDIAKILKGAVGWNRNTTYTVIGKLVKKGAVLRTDPKYMCTPLVTRSEVQHSETKSLIDRMFGGSRTSFFAAFLHDEKLTEDELAQLRRMIAEEEE